MKRLLSGLLLSLTVCANAQTQSAKLPTVSTQQVQWASRVVSFSSEGRGDGGGQQYKATQVLGKPSVLPNLADSPCAWSPLYPDSPSEEWIRVGFETPQLARQVLIAENINPGAVIRVILYDEQGREYPVYTNPEALPRTDGMLRIFPKDSAFLVREVKVFLNGSRIKGPNQIDAIGISDSKTPVKVAVNVSAETPAAIQKENLGRTINTSGEEVAPVISPDGRTLYFTRKNHKGNMGRPDVQDVWTATRTGDAWNEAVNIGAPINTTGDNAISGISPDGRTIYLINVYKPDGELSFGVSRSIRTRNGWSMPVECKINKNYNQHKENQLEFTVAPNGKVMILAVQRKDALGDRDLYVSFLQEDRTWSEPKSIGPVVNTAEAESSPFLAADGRSLYFTSLGHPGFGDGDIFVTRRLDDTWLNWSDPANLGPAINTAEWDGYFTIPAAGDYAYLSSSANSLGEDDIFRLKLYPAIKPDPVALVSGQVLDALSKKPVPTEVVTMSPKDNKEVAKAEIDPETAEYKMVLPTQKIYTITAKKDGYFPASEPLDLSKDKKYRDIRRNIYLIPIQQGQKIVMREVLFEQSQYTLIPGAEEELNHVVDMLRKYPGMEMLVEGHTDNQGDWEPNMKLSEDRVRVVKEYLLGKGIAASRIQTKAWGPSKPIASNETDEKRKLNRRVEFTILKM